MRKNILAFKGILLTFLVLSSLLTFGQAGKLDESFTANSNNYSAEPSATYKAYFNNILNQIFVICPSNDYVSNPKFSINSLNYDGNLNSSFKVFEVDNYFQQIAFQSDGKILIIGNIKNYNGHSASLLRLNFNGEVDETFNFGLTNSVKKVFIQNDDKLIIQFDYYDSIPLMRLNADGSVDNSFKSSNLLNYKMNDFTVQNNGDIVFSYYNQIDKKNYFKKVDKNCTIDSLFNSNYGFVNEGYNEIRMLTVKNNNILFTSGQSNGAQTVSRINDIGIIDSSFHSVNNILGSIYSLTETTNGKIIFAGRFTKYDNYPVNDIIRVFSDGKIDSTFNSGQGVNESIHNVNILPDGKILISGNFGQYDGNYIKRVARLMGDDESDSCYLRLNFKQNFPIGCNNPAQIIGKGNFGTPPYIYDWTNVEQKDDSLAILTKNGIYTCIVNDKNNCADTASIFVQGIEYISEKDYSSYLISTRFRTGFTNSLTISAINNGCNNQNGQLKLVLDSLVTYESATPTPDFISGDTLIWNFTDLYYLSTPFSPKVTLKTSVLAAIGDTVHLRSIITPISGDADSTNNIRDYYFPVINGYDPNDISVYPQGLCPEGFIKNDQTLTYTVRFQNTGNAEAVNIAVVDSLPSCLDMSTLRVVSSSDTMYTMVLPNNVIKFMFDSIMLPDSMHNEAESHGYVVYEIKPKTGLSEGTQIKNKVGIYFDFNPVVVTNTLLNTISANPSAVSCKVNSTVKVKPTKSQLYPNPSEGLFTLVSESNNTNISVLDQTGKMVLSQTATNNSTTLDLRNQSPGIYFIKVQSNKGVEVLKAVVNW